MRNFAPFCHGLGENFFVFFNKLLYFVLYFFIFYFGCCWKIERSSNGKVNFQRSKLVNVAYRIYNLPHIQVNYGTMVEIIFGSIKGHIDQFMITADQIAKDTTNKDVQKVE